MRRIRSAPFVAFDFPLWISCIPYRGATNVPDQPGSIVVAFSSQVGAWDMVLQSAGVPVDIATLGPPPSPSPAATAFFANPVYYGVAAPHLDAATEYTVALKETTLPCIELVSICGGIPGAV